MKQIKIQSIKDAEIPGVEIKLPGDAETYRESYLCWNGTRLPMQMNSTCVSGGVLKVWHHLPVFSKLEYHDDNEKYIFVQGDVIMPFADIKDGKVDEATLQYVRIQAGTEDVYKRQVY